MKDSSKLSETVTIKHTRPTRILWFRFDRLIKKLKVGKPKDK